ncbi:beta strand repeat-containing protein [Prevotella communis]|uniref:beta strand repeat-containing protein n=1 Tax=Prevotella communis TaxID=2913614 RepID=UPI001EDC4231|nr:InlB B-repeat-containing protein [Prevotella communis]UKK66837.1 InlB B-repeat-containing protein [Prevotella communis]
MKRRTKFILTRATMTLLLALFTTVGAWAEITGHGTPNDPYVLNTAGDWATFANESNAATYWGSNVYVKLSDTWDNSASAVTTMVGTSDHKFCGTFLGNGKTLTLNLTTDGSEYTAPFRYVDGATIKFLHTAGTVNGGNQKYATGLIGNAKGMVNITACRSSVAISSNRSNESNKDATHGGFIGVSEGAVTFTNCLFDGSITDTAATNCGGFVGWRNGSLTFNNCLMAGTMTLSTYSNSATFNRNSSSTLNHCYYKTAYGDVQGTQTSATGSDLQAQLGSGWKVSGNSVVPIMDVKNLGIATISGISGFYPYTGSEIAVDYTVTAADGTALTKGTHYTETICPATVQEKGDYTLIITGTSPYSGSQTFNFIVDDGLHVTSETTTITNATYRVTGNVTINSRVTINGDVTLIFDAGSSLTVTGGIGVNEGNSLTICGTGMLTTTASGYNASIGGDNNHSAGNITISGCTVNATAAFLGAAIGGGCYGANATQDTGTSTITLNGCVVTATSTSTGPDVAAIGGGMCDDSHTYNVNINGGQITVNNNGESKRSGYIKGNVNLDWTDFANDFIVADGYNGTFTFKHPFQYDNSGTPTIVTAENIGSLGGKRLTPYTAQTYTVTFDTGEGATTVATQTLPEGFTATRPDDPLRTGYRFTGWKSGSTAYDFTATVTANLTLTAEWETVSAISYINTEGQTVSGFTQYIALEAGHTTLDGNVCPTWVVDADLTQSSRITVKNSVTLILTDGKTLTAQKGISVTANDNAALTILAQSGGTGALTVTGVNNHTGDACIGGDWASGKYNCGTVSIYGGRITTSGNHMGAGIGGANGYQGGTINILGGQVDVSGGSYGGHAIGYGYLAKTATATITLGWRNATDYIMLRPGVSGTACCKGTVTLASNFLLDGTTTKARWTSESVNNINSQKLVPNTTVQTDWADIQAVLTAGGTIELTNDVSSKSGDEMLVVGAGKTATIDLNGHTLTHNNATGTGDNNSVIEVRTQTSALTIRSTGSTGHIAGNLDGIYNCGTLTLTNVAISGLGGLAIYNHGTGTLTLTDVSVTDNTHGGIENYGTLNLAGKVTVTGNTLNSSACNVFLASSSVITLTGALDSDSRIGVGGANDYAITSGANGKATLANFISDEAHEYICWTTDGSEVQMNRRYFINERDGMADLTSRHQGETVPVRFARSFTSGVPSTICLPFKINPATYTNYGTFYTFEGVDKTTSPWTVTMEETNSYLSDAGTPLLFMPKQTGSVTFEPFDGSPTIASSYTAGTTTMGDWTYKGTYEEVKWTTEPTGIYGFSAQAVADAGISQGQFVKVGAYVRVKPLRCYLEYQNGIANAARRHAAASDATATELPKTLNVRLIGSDGQQTAIGTLDTQTGEVTLGNWYTLDGTPLSGKPSAKGIYINNGKKMVIK